MTPWPVQEGVFELGDWPAERGGVIRSARLAWQTHGTLNAARDNVIVYPTSYTATHDGQSWAIGPDSILDPERYFIVIPDMFSNGLSSGAANTPDYPAVVTLRDNVLAQERLLREVFGVTHLAAAYGFSMGAMQAYHWAALFPERVQRAFVVCGSARTAPHNRVFLSGLLRTLEAAPEYIGNGQFSAVPHGTLRAFGHIYAGWGLSQDFYRQDLFRTVLGAPDLETYLQTDWEASFAARDAANLYAQALTWFHGDISANALYGGDLAAALGAIQARVLLLPGETDLYFRVADNAAERAHLKHGELNPIPSVWGHRAGSPAGLPQELAFLKGAVRGALATESP
ncbi:alpha/beta fold hydrolase [Deinococcus radiopugnans]|uniref:Alpha/beta fold hydrolase n=1 Tax=Deinococcus radiopugnans ATCC 19172 TaxID=585398 RepID=A0A5C4YB81_9DEIO|nr:alpha/beta fold hydrolase [Deinococcus radiopugnans]MBB6015354.1 homoserine O-acetyltransferase [Deinococcus radiopugnans ATCC 19172]TNM72952.1 alpha/beta fold hydrolase [Deinococcus radiopugnans ATCC 19172]